MALPVVHFEIIGTDPTALRGYYADLFGWNADTDSAVAPEISDAGDYGFIEHDPESGPVGIPGGVGGGPQHPPHTIFYVGVPDVAAALADALRLGGSPVLDPVPKPDGELVVAHFADPEGNVIGLAGPK